MYTFTAIYMHELFCNIRLLTYIMHKIHYRDKYTYVCRYLLSNVKIIKLHAAQKYLYVLHVHCFTFM